MMRYIIRKLGSGLAIRAGTVTRTGCCTDETAAVGATAVDDQNPCTKKLLDEDVD